MKKWKWLIAGLLFVTIFSSRYTENEKVDRMVQSVVYNSNDLQWMRTTLREVFDREQQTVEVTKDQSDLYLTKFVSIKPYYKGFILFFEETVPIIAYEHGLVVFTGHTKNTGKTISVFYNDDTTVTFGFVDQLSLLPYTSVAKGASLGLKDEGELYIEIEQNGAHLNLQQTIEWLRAN
ncbi:hypothetical protein [Solibacillus sp. FSL H8-0538]|uniref:hypothetical protein n=1 Tax=Solibacillus sp. FSL H8-0538 TaxID=2921400 RepID=UPI0030FA80F3